MARLNDLPIHSALLYANKRKGKDILALIEEYKYTLNQLDFDGYTPIDIIVYEQICKVRNVKTYKTDLSIITKDIFYRILLESLPFDVVTLQLVDDKRRSHGWMQAVQSECRVIVAAVEQVIETFESQIRLLAYCTDDMGRRAVDVACGRNREAIFRRVYIHGRFDLKDGLPEHSSATSVVYIAKDHGHSLNVHQENRLAIRNVPSLIALKFMRNRDQFMKELIGRRVGDFSASHVIPVLMAFDGDGCSSEDVKFRMDSTKKGFQDYPYCIVMEAGSYSLKHVIDHERVVRYDWVEIKGIVRTLARCLQHVHSKGYVHGDLKRE